MIPNRRPTLAVFCSTLALCLAAGAGAGGDEPPVSYVVKVVTEGDARLPESLGLEYYKYGSSDVPLPNHFYSWDRAAGELKIQREAFGENTRPWIRVIATGFFSEREWLNKSRTELRLEPYFLPPNPNDLLPDEVDPAVGRRLLASWRLTNNPADPALWQGESCQLYWNAETGYLVVPGFLPAAVKLKNGRMILPDRKYRIRPATLAVRFEENGGQALQLESDVSIVPKDPASGLKNIDPRPGGAFRMLDILDAAAVRSIAFDRLSDHFTIRARLKDADRGVYEIVRATDAPGEKDVTDRPLGLNYRETGEGWALVSTTIGVAARSYRLSVQVDGQEIDEYTNKPIRVDYKKKRSGEVTRAVGGSRWVFDQESRKYRIEITPEKFGPDPTATASIKLDDLDASAFIDVSSDSARLDFSRPYIKLHLGKAAADRIRSKIEPTVVFTPVDDKGRPGIPLLVKDGLKPGQQRDEAWWIRLPPGDWRKWTGASIQLGMPGFPAVVLKGVRSRKDYDLRRWSPGDEAAKEPQKSLYVIVNNMGRIEALGPGMKDRINTAQPYVCEKIVLKLRDEFMVPFEGYVLASEGGEEGKVPRVSGLYDRGPTVPTLAGHGPSASRHEKELDHVWHAAHEILMNRIPPPGQAPVADPGVFERPELTIIVVTPASVREVVAPDLEAVKLYAGLADLRLKVVTFVIAPRTADGGPVPNGQSYVGPMPLEIAPGVNFRNEIGPQISKALADR